MILDNYRIHHSRMTKMVVAASGGKIQLHFLPPYCPEENKIERFWEDLHAEVTHNHRCDCMEELMYNVRDFLRPHTERAKRNNRRRAA